MRTVVLMWAASCCVSFAFADDPVRLTFSVSDAAGKPSPCRIHLSGSDGMPVKPEGLPFWRDHFCCDGSADVDVEPGTYRYAIERGPEHERVNGAIDVAVGNVNRVTGKLGRIANLGGDGWYSGDLHVHRSPQEIELLMRAEDLDVAEVITWWNTNNLWKNRDLPAERPTSFDGRRYYDVVAGEDERDGGALLYFQLPRPIEITKATRDAPSSVVFAREARQSPGVWLDIEKPFWWDAPMWLALGLGDSIGIANNHMNRSTVMGNEAWGHPRDLSRYPGIDGNGLWTQDIYYHALNCGIRIPPSAGSASGVLPNPVGYNRVYVRVDGDLTWEKWWEGLKAGRCFVTNGPLLRVRANGKQPGHVFRQDGREPLVVRLEGEITSNDPVRAVELVQNGRVERIELPATIEIREPGWFLVRVIADVDETFRFASTGPFYVERGEDQRPVRSESARFFLDWTRQRIAALREKALADETTVLAPWLEAEGFWEARLEMAEKDSR